MIIWNEAHENTLEVIDRSLQEETGIRKPFPEKVVILGGDFMQVLPIFPKETMNKAINVSCSELLFVSIDA